MMTSKDGTARTEIGQHNTISVVMADLPKAEKAAGTREGASGGDGCRKEEEARMFLENMHRGDQEDHPNRHEYRDYDYDIHGND
jgi:hypothetical protein